MPTVLYFAYNMATKRFPETNFPPIPSLEAKPATPVKRYLLLIVLVVMAITASYLLISGFGAKQTPKPIIDTGRPQVAETQANADISIVDRVKQHIVINETETPTVWTISNLDLVKPQNPVLFKDAELGDYLIAWSDLAVVYSGKKDRVVGMLMASPGKDLKGVDIADANATTTQNQATAQVPEQAPAAPAQAPADTVVPAEPTHVEIRNASGVTGAAKRLKTKLVADGLAVDGVGDAALKRDGTLVVDLTGGTAADAVSKVASETGGTVVTAVPDGEPASTSGILVLIGR
jgi:hypothetical protein